MFTKLSKFKFLLISFLAFLMLNAHGEPVTENEVEDINLVISQFVGGAPNALFIMDVSGSMGRNFGGTQVGNWTGSEETEGVIQQCERDFCNNGNCNNDQDRTEASHCAENTANLTVCGSKHCFDGTCNTQDEFNNFLACLDEEVETRFNIVDFTSTQTATCIFNAVCGNNNDICGETAADCTDSSNQMEVAAAALEAVAGLTTCSSIDECLNDGQAQANTNTSCNTSLDYSEFQDCMFDIQEIDIFPDNPDTENINENENCTARVPDPDNPGSSIFVNTNCSGRPADGSTRLDITLNVIFDFLDADDSLAEKNCDDPSMLFNGEDSVISCQNYMNTPFRDVSQIVRQDGSPPSNRRLPISNAGDEPLIRELTDEDADELNIRLRPLTYSGLGNWDGCTDQQTFQVAQGGFAGASETSFRNVWRFFRRLEPNGGTPLAYVLGFDDNNGNGGGGGNVINDDALGVYRVELQTDPAVDCRPEFVIILTDGEDTCSGECDATNNSCTGSTTTNANRRSSIQAVSNLRTYYSRNPFQNRGETLQKEIHTFVIGLGIPEANQAARRTLNAMALAGGTHTQGIIQHTDPTGGSFGNVNIDDVLPAIPGLDPFKALAKAEGIDTNPSLAHLQGCLSPDEDESCSISVDGSSENIFGNDFFNNGTPFTGGQDLDGFAFFPNNADELRAALESITNLISGFAIAGVSPAAPQSGTSLALRDRIFVSILTPITDQRFWQGRLGLYGFVEDPSNPGSRRVVRVPDAGVDLTDPNISESVLEAHDIFNPEDGALNRDNASRFHWEAAKNLTERDINGIDPRNIYTVNLGNDNDFLGSGFVDSSFDGALRYIGEKTDFSDELAPEYFGISDNDVDDPIPAYCGSLPDEEDNFADCNTECVLEGILDLSLESCKTCVKNCIRDRIVSFMSGNTDITPVGDPIGGPVLDGDTVDEGSSSIGIDCPNPDTGTGSNDQCEVRLGDIFHADPVIVGSPPVGFNDIGFRQYRNAFFDRSNVVYAGANDGGIHAFHAGELQLALPDNPLENPFNGRDEILPFFDEGTGWEMFMFIPPTFLPDSIAPEDADTNIDKDPESHLTQVFGDQSDDPAGPGFSPDFRSGDLKSFVTDNLVQRAFFDGSPLIFEAFIDGYDNGIASGENSFCEIDTPSVETPDGQIDLCGKEWHTIMVSGYRNGGGGYTALDVTNAACVNPDKASNTCDSIDKFTTVAPTFDDLNPRFNDSESVPDFPSHLWTLFDQDFGNTWSRPVPARVRMLVNDGGGSGEPIQPFPDRWLLFVGGGLDPIDTKPDDGVNFGRALYAIDAATGKIVYKFHSERMYPSSISDNQSASINQQMKCDMASRPSVFDLNNDSFADTVYTGDTCGRLWRFDISQPIVVENGNVTETGIDGTANLTAPDWVASIAYCAGTDAQCGSANNPSTPQDNPNTDTNEVQSIYFSPTLVPDDLGRNHIILLTGSRRDPSNINDFGKLVNFIDPFRPSFNNGGLDGTAVGLDTMVTEDDFDGGQILRLEEDSSTPGLFNVTGGASINNQGEFIIEFADNSPTITGEKGVGTPIVINRTLIFTTFAPDAGASDDPCSTTSGVGRVFAVDYLSGEPSIANIPGATKLLEDRFDIEGDDTASIAGISMAEGIPSEAKITFARGSVILTAAFSGGPDAGAQFLVWEGPPFPTDTQTLFWEELF